MFLQTAHMIPGVHSVSGAQSGGDPRGRDALQVHRSHLRGRAHAQVPRAEGGVRREGERGAEAAARGGRGPLEEAGEGRGVGQGGECGTVSTYHQQCCQTRR